MLSVANYLDFESQSSYHFRVQATDGGEWVTRVPVNIFYCCSNGTNEREINCCIAGISFKIMCRFKNAI